MQRRLPPLAGHRIVWSLPEYRIPVCSPKLSARVPLRCMLDLEKHTLLHSTSRPTVGSDWLHASGAPDLKPQHSLVFEHNCQTLQAALLRRVADQG
jgi:LysR family transcriptional regulator, glycine cleavage system transcriptional activator